MAEETTTTTQTPRSLSVEEANKPILDITGEQALMGADTMNPATGETIPGATTSQLVGKAEYKPTDKTVEGDKIDPETGLPIPGTGELLTTTGKTLGVSTSSPTGTSADTVAAVATPTESDAAQIDTVERTNSSVGTATAAQGAVSTGVIIDPNQIMDGSTKQDMFERGSLADAKTQTLAAEASTKYQVEQLMAALDSGAELPPWALRWLQPLWYRL